MSILEAAGTATVQIPGKRLREKFALAMVVFARKYPALARQFAVECDMERKALKRRSGAWTGDDGKADTDMVHLYLRPPMVFEWLALTETQSLIAADCGAPVGIGKPMWWNDRGLLELFLDEVPHCRLSDQRGVPKRNV